MPSQLAGALALCSALTLASGCVPSKYPLSDEKTSKVDERRIGTWIQGDDPEEVPMVLRRRSGANILEDSEGESLFTTTVGDDWYMSVPYNDYETGGVSWFILGYKISEKGQLKVYGLHTDAVAHAVATRELAGKVESRRVKSWWSSSHVDLDVAISDSAEHIRTFLEKHGRKCWSSDDDYVGTYIRK